MQVLSCLNGKNFCLIHATGIKTPSIYGTLLYRRGLDHRYRISEIFCKMFQQHSWETTCYLLKCFPLNLRSLRKAKMCEVRKIKVVVILQQPLKHKPFLFKTYQEPFQQQKIVFQDKQLLDRKIHNLKRFFFTVLNSYLSMFMIVKCKRFHRVYMESFYRWSLSQPCVRCTSSVLLYCVVLFFFNQIEQMSWTSISNSIRICFL